MSRLILLVIVLVALCDAKMGSKIFVPKNGPNVITPSQWKSQVHNDPTISCLASYEQVEGEQPTSVIVEYFSCGTTSPTNIGYDFTTRTLLVACTTGDCRFRISDNANGVYDLDDLADTCCSNDIDIATYSVVTDCHDTCLCANTQSPVTWIQLANEGVCNVTSECDCHNECTAEENACSLTTSSVTINGPAQTTGVAPITTGVPITTGEAPITTGVAPVTTGTTGKTGKGKTSGGITTGTTGVPVVTTGEAKTITTGTTGDGKGTGKSSKTVVQKGHKQNPWKF